MYNNGKECGDCENCWMRKQHLPDDCFVINGEPLGFIYDLYCRVDDKSIGSLHNTKAELCNNFIERKVPK